MSDATLRPTPPGHPTRQQLDELEALMQRMLSLPIDPADESSDQGAISLQPPPEPLSPAAVTSPWQVVPNEPLPLKAESPAKAPANEMPAFGIPKQPEGLPVVTSASTPAATGPAGRRMVLKRRKAIFGWRRWNMLGLLAPLIWFNVGFDHLTSRMGRPGRWLCGSLGRMVLGWLGLLLLAAAIAL